MCEGSTSWLLKAALQLLGDATFKGGPLITLKHGMLASPCVSDVDKNSTWVEPIVKSFAEKVPSAYMLGDCFLAIDRLCDGKLLQDSSGKLSKGQMALQEGSKAAKIVGYLRYLYRNSGTSKNPVVTMLKQYLVLSDRSKKRRCASRSSTTAADSLSDKDQLNVYM